MYEGWIAPTPPHSELLRLADFAALLTGAAAGFYTIVRSPAKARHSAHFQFRTTCGLEREERRRAGWLYGRAWRGLIRSGNLRFVEE